MTNTATRQRQAYEALLRAGNDAPFISERPALFSPAAAAQDESNRKGAFGRFAQILLPQEYADGWLAESQAHVQSAYLGDWTSRVLRTGISGELGYELHGPADDADAVWRLITAAGQEFGLRQLGFRSQPVQHIEAGIATNGLDYIPAAAITPGAPRQFRRGVIGGSFIPTGGFTDYFRKPGELGWAPRTLPAHDFLGRDALAADAASGVPGRVLVGLTWHPADVSAVLTAVLGDGEIPEPMEIPRLPGPSFDQVLRAGAAVGVSTGRTVSPTLRAMISLCVIGRDHAAPGTEVAVVWGRPGTPQREIRATVTALPFKPDRRRTDVTAL